MPLSPLEREVSDALGVLSIVRWAPLGLHTKTPQARDHVWRLDDVVDDDDDPLVYLRGQWVRRSFIDQCIQDALREAERQGIVSRDPQRPGVWRSNIIVPKVTNGES